MEIEATYVLVGGEGENAEERDPVNLTPLLDSGLLEVVDIDTEDEAESFVNLAFDLDDGEARTIAVAIHRGDIVATDDRKARQVVERLVPRVMLFSTTEILQRWSLIEGVTEDQLRRALSDVQQRGRFLPPRHDPLREWWQGRVASG
jgi:predicted nucleic acid-binding protein